MGSLSPPRFTCQPPPESPPSSYTVLASFINPLPDSSVPNWIDEYHPTTNSCTKLPSYPGFKRNKC
ncbi:unnamed protein product [Rhodiola kirilowii]